MPGSQALSITWRLEGSAFSVSIAALDAVEVDYARGPALGPFDLSLQAELASDYFQLRGLDEERDEANHREEPDASEKGDGGGR